MARERKNIWARVDALHAESNPHDEGFTVQEYASRYSMTLDAAMHRLKRLTLAGKLLAGWKRAPSGCKTRVFRFPD